MDGVLKKKGGGGEGGRENTQQQLQGIEFQRSRLVCFQLLWVARKGRRSSEK